MNGRGAVTRRRALGGVLLGCALVAAAPGPAAGRPADMNEPYLRAVRAHDEAVLKRAGAAPPELPGALEALFGTLDTEAKGLAIRLVVKQGGPATGAWLLRRTGTRT